MFCSHCGAEVDSTSAFCPRCGSSLHSAARQTPRDNTMVILVKVFLILGCVSVSWALIPLAWCIPMTVKAFRCMKEGTPMSGAFKVCTLIFVNLIAGIILLCASDEQLTEIPN